MKHILISIAASFILIHFSNKTNSQPPNLGLTSGYAFFTAVGAISNVGASNITGNVGTNVGAFTGFPPGIITGEIHVADPASAQAAIDVQLAYNELFAKTCNQVLPSTTLGNGQTLTPGVYCSGAASSLNGNLFLDAANDPTAVFVIQINGAFSTSTFSNVELLNKASIDNVFWQINGAFILGDGSVFKGTIIANGAITLLEASALDGRGLSTAGAISLNNNLVNPVITILPLKVTDFSAFNSGSFNQIKWMTETDNAESAFELEHSNDSRHFTLLSKTKENGQNNTYDYTDRSPYSGMNYYRLKMMEESGAFVYSNIVKAFVKTTGHQVITAYPNPIKDNLNIVLTGFSGKNGTIKITDIFGKILKEMTTTSNSMTENKSTLAAGMYFLIYTENNISQRLKIIKQ